MVASHQNANNAIKYIFLITTKKATFTHMRILCSAEPDSFLENPAPFDLHKSLFWLQCLPCFGNFSSFPFRT